MKEFNGAPALDAGLLAAARAVKHYEIARYGTLKAWAAGLRMNQAVKLSCWRRRLSRKGNRPGADEARRERGQPARTAGVRAVFRRRARPGAVAGLPATVAQG
jgi:hypothetical protein